MIAQATGIARAVATATGTMAWTGFNPDSACVVRVEPATLYRRRHERWGDRRC